MLGFVNFPRRRVRFTTLIDYEILFTLPPSPNETENFLYIKQFPFAILSGKGFL